MKQGYLSYTITAIEENQIDLRSMTGLPKDAENIKNKAISTSKESVVSLKAMQKLLQMNAQQMFNDLEQALSILKENTKKSLEYTQNCNKIATQTSEQLEDNIEYNKGIRALFFQYHQELNNSLSALEEQTAKLIVEAQKATAEANKFKNERYYFLALGPFGLAGLATATGLFITWSDKANKANKAVSKSKKELNNLQLFKDNIGMLQDSFSMSVEVLSGSKNVLVLLMGSVHNILNNITDENEEITVISLYLNAAIKEASVLILDVA